jgi:hypothetical protein
MKEDELRAAGQMCRDLAAVSLNKRTPFISALLMGIGCIAQHEADKLAVVATVRGLKPRRSGRLSETHEFGVPPRPVVQAPKINAVTTPMGKTDLYGLPPHALASSMRRGAPFQCCENDERCDKPCLSHPDFEMPVAESVSPRLYCYAGQVASVRALLRESGLSGRELTQVTNAIHLKGSRFGIFIAVEGHPLPIPASIYSAAMNAGMLSITLSDMWVRRQAEAMKAGRASA